MKATHIDIYREEGMFAGWPANNGIWSFGDEIVVGFIQGWLEKTDRPGHKIDYEKPSYSRQSRSLDGGRTWTFEAPPELERPFEMEIRDFDGRLDFTDPELAIRLYPSGTHAGSRSLFYYSTDRCHTWIGPFNVPNMGLTGISARTELLVLNRDEAILFLACPKADGYEGRACCAMLREGGKRFEFLSYIGDEPPGFTIMPAGFRRQDGSLIVIVREEDRFDNPNRGARLTQFVSNDVGKTWTFDQYVAQFTHSTPPALKQMPDGRLCCVYGYRDEPCGVRCKVSQDEGRSWGKEIVLRDDGGNTDLGYTRLTALPDGSMLTAYYYNTDANGGRYISSTIFSL